ncbi:hypothetical protein QWJ07_04300 [Frankia sp. RB7]|nr:hypothetical protein [Frankia sp. RB7]
MWRRNGANALKRAFQAGVAGMQLWFPSDRHGVGAGKTGKNRPWILIKLSYLSLLNLGLW